MATEVFRGQSRRRSAACWRTPPSVSPRGSSRNFRAWSDCGGDLERNYTKDQALDNITLYSVTKTATSSGRLYYEMRRAGSAAVPHAAVVVPTGVAHYPGEVTRASRVWAERRYHITHWVEMLEAAGTSPPWRCRISSWAMSVVLRVHSVERRVVRLIALVQVRIGVFLLFRVRDRR